MSTCHSHGSHTYLVTTTIVVIVTICAVRLLSLIFPTSYDLAASILDVRALEEFWRPVVQVNTPG